MKSPSRSERFWPAAFGGATFLVTGLLLGGCVTQPERVLSPNEIDTIRQIHSPDSVDDVIDMEPEELKSYLVELTQTDIEFFGMILDGNGNPIENAKIEALVFDRLLDPLVYPYLTGPIVPVRKTDRQGRFSLTGIKGAAVLVVVSKVGYRPLDDSRRFFYFPDELHESNLHPLPTLEEPAIFRLVDNDDSALHRISTGSIPLPSNGESIEISLRKYTPYGVEEGRGDLRVTFQSGEIESNGRYDWTCTLSSPGGGIQRYDDLLKDLAPEDGYGDSFRITMKASDGNWSERETRLLILKMRDENYAVIEFSIRIAGDRFFAADGTWNDTGDRHVTQYY